MVQSAGILVYRKIKDLEVLLVHPSGPYFKNKDKWSIPRGIKEDNEDIKDTALREFKEETGLDIKTNLTYLGTHKTSNKEITIYIIECNSDITKFHSNTFTLHSKEYPENDKIAWFTIESAKQKIFKNQLKFIELLGEIQNGSI